MGFCLTYAGDLSRECVLRAIADRIDSVPRLRQRVVRAPLAVAQALWEDDPGFDLDSHVEEVALDSTADDRSLAATGGARFATPLDMERPLWKMIVVRGPERLGTSVIWKLHHAMADLPAAFELVEALHGGDVPDLSPDGGRAHGARAPGTGEPPGSWTRLAHALTDQALSTSRWSIETMSRLLEPGELANRMARMSRAALRSAEAFTRPAPASPINGKLSSDRHFAWGEYDLEDFLRVRAALGGTVNDVFLAVTGDALGR